MTLAQLSILASTEARLQQRARQPQAQPGTIADLEAMVGHRLR